MEPSMADYEADVVSLIHAIASEDVVPTGSDVSHARLLARESLRNARMLLAGLYALSVRHTCVLPPRCTRCDALTEMTKAVEGEIARLLRNAPWRFEG